MKNRIRGLTRSLFLLVLAAACRGEDVPATQVIVSVNSDLDVGTELTSVAIFVLDGDGDEVVAMHPFELTDARREEGKVRLPFSIGIEKRQATRFRLDVIGYGPSGTDGESMAVVEQKVSASFRDRETLLVKVFLGAPCLGNVCPDETTCYVRAERDVAAGECGDIMEPELQPVRPGTEGDAWNTAGAGGSRGEAGAGTRAPAAERGGEAGRAGAPSDAGSAGSTGTGGMGGAGAGASGAGGKTGAGGASGGAGGTAGTPACEPTGELTHPTEGEQVPHVTTTMPSDYASQPPSSGPHCEQSGVYATFPPEAPLLPCHFVRNLERGAIVLLYNCPTPCPEIVAALEQVIADATANAMDPDCTPVDGLQRLLVTPYASMDATFAATAWGATWTSSCSEVTADDHAALLAFIQAHWGTRGNAPLPNDCSYGMIYPPE